MPADHDVIGGALLIVALIEFGAAGYVWSLGLLEFAWWFGAIGLAAGVAAALNLVAYRRGQN